MASTTTMFRAARPAFNQTVVPRLVIRHQARQNFYQQGSRRWQSTNGGAGAGAQQEAGGSQQQQASWFKKAWESEVGIRTVHFWAPVMKWALVLAGISDFARPAENLSLTQNAALTATGVIWTRWCLIIKPKNYLLAAVNFFLGLVGVTQVSRILLHESSKKREGAAAASTKTPAAASS